MRTMHTLVLVFALGLIWVPSAHAYLDAGTGSLILQILLGGVAGVLVGWKFFWHKVRDMVGGWRKK